jgi:hypothetical protein
MDKQNEMITQDLKQYPFTQINPHASWWDRMRIHYFGESFAEHAERLEARSYAWKELKDKSPGISKGISIQPSPSITTVGLNTPKIPSASLDLSAAGNWYQETFSKLTAAPNTPTLSPLNLDSPFKDNPVEAAVRKLSSYSNELDQVTDNITASPPKDFSVIDTSLQERFSNLKDTRSYASTLKDSEGFIISNNGKHN